MTIPTKAFSGQRNGQSFIGQNLTNQMPRNVSNDFVEIMIVTIDRKGDYVLHISVTGTVIMNLLIHMYTVIVKMVIE